MDSRVSHSKNFDWPLISLLFLAVFLRFYWLELKPPHHDEGVNGAFVESVVAKGFYNYDPQNYHGPLHFYLIFLSESLFGRNIWALRFPSALAGVLTVWVLFAFRGFIGRRPAYLAALFAALSPGMVYFNRHAIHESELVLFTVIAVWGFWGLSLEGRRIHLWALLLGLAGTIVSKETFSIHTGVFVVATILLLLWEKGFPSAPAAKAFAIRNYSPKDVLVALAVSLFLIVFFYSGTFLNIREFPAYFKMFENWTKTGITKSGHSKPFMYWAQTLARYEFAVIAGAVCSIVLLFTRSRASRLVRQTGLYGIGVFLAYSFISYKTAWCVINLIWPFFIPLGWGLDFLLTRKPHAAITAILVLAMASFAVCWEVNFIHYDDSREPYAYVQTNREITKLTDRLSAASKKDPSLYNLTGYVLRPDSYWPMPWVLGSYKNIAWYQGHNRPADYDADVMVIDMTRVPDAEKKLRKPYFVESFVVIAGQTPSKIYFNAARFKDYFPGRRPEFEPRSLPATEALLPGQGLAVSYYKKTDDGKERLLISRGKVGDVDFVWQDKARPTEGPFEADFTGEILIENKKEKFLFVADDGGWVEIDGKRIISDPGPHPAKETEGVFEGEPGWKKIRIWYYDIGGCALARLLRETDPGAYAVIPSGAFRSEISGGTS